jgi:hypothetical protein
MKFRTSLHREWFLFTSFASNVIYDCFATLNYLSFWASHYYWARSQYMSTALHDYALASGKMNDTCKGNYTRKKISKKGRRGKA